MNEDQWEQVKELFHQAQALPTEDRVDFLDKACAGDTIVREKVDDLLVSYESGFLADPILHDVVEIVGAENNFQEGQVIGRYRLKELIGIGGMGQVYRADDTELNRPVAFKVLHEEVAGDKERVRRFIQEARAASALNHPNILTIHEIGSFEGARFIVSEYVGGETLRERMRTGLTSAESLDIMCQIAAALQAAHSAGIVHRDIKPENIMLRQDGLVKVLDFGLAKLTEAGEMRNADCGMRIEENDLAGIPISEIPHSAIRNPHFTAPGLIMGTVAYMSPEQARGQAVDSRTDLWSLGVVFHEMLTGESPFKGDRVTDLVTSIIKHDPASLDLTTISQELKPICTKALAKDKKARYQTAQDLLQDLQGEKKRMEYAIQSTPFITGSSTDELKTQLIRPRPTLSAEYFVTGIKRHKLATLTVLTIVTVLAAGLSMYKYNGTPPMGNDPALSSAIGSSTTDKDLKMSLLTSSGNIKEISISPDGKFIAYITEDGPEKNSLRLREIATSVDVTLVPAPPVGQLMDLSFAPDVDYVYFGQVTRTNQNGIEDLYRVPIGGGPSKKITDDTDSGLSFSPDGKTIAFTRDVAEGENLIIANPDGSGERKIVLTKLPGNWVECGSVPQWSPDGKSIACFVTIKENREQYLQIVSVNVADGSQRPFSDNRWRDYNGGVYLPDGSLLIAAKEMSPQQLTPSQLWLIAPNSPPKSITNDLNDYKMVSATRKGDTVVTLQSSDRRELWVLPNNDVVQGRQVTRSIQTSGGFWWMPDGKLVISSGVSGNGDLWTMNADGTNRIQLTRDQGFNRSPSMSGDGKYILFSSDRSDGKEHIYRMDPDGGNLKQLTAGFEQQRPRSSPDGKWIYYIQNPNRPQNSVCKISIDGGEPVTLVTSTERSSFTIADVDPVTGRIAYVEGSRVDDHVEYKIIIVSPNGGPPIRTLDLPRSGRGSFIRWTPDGKAIAFNDDRNNSSGDIWAIPISSKGKQMQLTNFRTPITLGFNWTRDGKQLAVSRGTVTNSAVIIRKTTE